MSSKHVPAPVARVVRHLNDCPIEVLGRLISRRRLHAALGPEWALLGPDRLAEVARARLGDVVTLRGNGDAMLVRPDGHLGWRGTDPAALEVWLDTALGRRTGVLSS